MRRRLLAATISAVALAMVLLGIPLAVFAAQVVYDDAVADLDSRAGTVAQAIEVRIRDGENVSSATLETFLGGRSSYSAHIEVTLPSGEVLSAGERPGRAFHTTHITDSGVVVVMYISWWDVFWRAARAVGIVVAVGVVAVGAGILMANWQARRLAAPLVYLAASAEQLGAGQVKPRLVPSGVEEIDLVTDEIARSADRMSARLASERQFASDASHQLRTPLTALSMRLEEIVATSTQEEVRHEAEVSLTQIERLVGVVDDLLARTRNARGSSTERVELESVMRQQATEWAPSYEAAGRTLTFDTGEETVFATPGALAQVIATLLENSLKHGGGTTTVATRPSGNDRAVVVEVSDEGDGVEDSLALRIFDRNVTSGAGSGLGLALARDLAAADGGRLELSQRVPATFSLFLQGVPRMVNLDEVVPHSRLRRRRRKS